MSGSFSYYLETRLLQLVFNGVPYVPGGMWVGLFTSQPSPSAPGTELSGNGYARPTVAFTLVTTTPPPSASNNITLQWPPATAAWGQLVGAGLFDAFTGGNMLAQGILVSPTDGITPQPVQINQGDIFLFPMGAITVGFAVATTGAPSHRAQLASQPVLRPLVPRVVRAPRQVRARPNWIGA